MRLAAGIWGDMVGTEANLPEFFSVFCGACSPVGAALETGEVDAELNCDVGCFASGGGLKPLTGLPPAGVNTSAVLATGSDNALEYGGETPASVETALGSVRGVDAKGAGGRSPGAATDCGGWLLCTGSRPRIFALIASISPVVRMSENALQLVKLFT